MSHRALKVLVSTSFLLLMLSFSAAHAQTYNVTVNMGAASYAGDASISISGVVTPAPGPNTAVVLTVYSPTSIPVDVSNNVVNPTTGAYSYTLVAGGSVNWVAGTYKVNATWGGDGAAASAVTNFQYTTGTTTTSTTSSTTSTVTVTSTTTATTTLPAQTVTATTTSVSTSTSTSVTIATVTQPAQTVTTTATTTNIVAASLMSNVDFLAVAAVAVIAILGCAVLALRGRVS